LLGSSDCVDAVGEVGLLAEGGALWVAVDGGLDAGSVGGVALLGSADWVVGVVGVGLLAEGGALRVAVDGGLDAGSVGGVALPLHAASSTARVRVVGAMTRAGLMRHVLSSWA
jgi:hypothetical protein